MDNNKSKDLSSVYFKQFMKYRKQTIKEISEHTGISNRTIQGYAQGRPPFCNAPAKNFIKITDYMEVDPHYMLGDDEWQLDSYFDELYDKYKEKYNLECSEDIENLPDYIRLTEQTFRYRAKRKKLRASKREMRYKLEKIYSYKSRRREMPEMYFMVTMTDKGTLLITRHVDGTPYSIEAQCDSTDPNLYMIMGKYKIAQVNRNERLERYKNLILLHEYKKEKSED